MPLFWCTLLWLWKSLPSSCKHPQFNKDLDYFHPSQCWLTCYIYPMLREQHTDLPRGPCGGITGNTNMLQWLQKTEGVFKDRATFSCYKHTILPGNSDACCLYQGNFTQKVKANKVNQPKAQFNSEFEAKRKNRALNLQASKSWTWISRQENFGMVWNYIFT